MIKNPTSYNEIKKRSLASEPIDLHQKYVILESLYNEARKLGKFDEQDILQGLDDDVRLAEALNASVRKPSR